ncbi:MAG: hypothetical protein II919_04510 [Lachnospiraceae bacterium]|nr:hypothetical protein [Lachnospiraceae bacterium]
MRKRTAYIPLLLLIPVLCGCTRSSIKQENNTTLMAQQDHDTSLMAQHENDTSFMTQTEKITAVSDGIDIQPHDQTGNQNDDYSDSQSGSQNNTLTDEQVFTPYAIETLTDRQRYFYEEMNEKILSLTPFTYTAEEYDADTIDDIIVARDALMTDNTSYRNYFCLDFVFSEDGNADILALESRYYCLWELEENRNPDDIRSGIDLFEQTCDEIIAAMPENATAYEKYHYLAEQLSERVDYDYENEYPEVVGSYCIVTGHGICVGYAEAYQYLCMKANLYCHMVFGSNLDESDYHEWNLIKLDGKTYHVDVTWADECGIPGDAAWERYFAMTQEEVLEDHMILDGTIATGHRK